MNKIKNEFKIYIIIISIMTMVIAVATTYIYHLLKTDVPEINTLKVIAGKEVVEFTKTHHKNMDCINESLKRLKSCDIGDFKSRIINKLFLQQCLMNTKKSQELCNEIFSQQKNEHIKTSRWTTQTCLNHTEIHNMVCANTLEAVESFCTLSSEKP